MRSYPGGESPRCGRRAPASRSIAAGRVGGDRGRHAASSPVDLPGLGSGEQPGRRGGVPQHDEVLPLLLRFGADEGKRLWREVQQAERVGPLDARWRCDPVWRRCPPLIPRGPECRITRLSCRHERFLPSRCRRHDRGRRQRSAPGPGQVRGSSAARGVEPGTRRLMVAYTARKVITSMTLAGLPDESAAVSAALDVVSEALRLAPPSRRRDWGAFDKPAGDMPPGATTSTGTTGP